jgi:anti-sigma factor RsiW
VLVITFTWTVTSGFSPLVQEAVEQHSTALPVDFGSSDSDEVEGWFRAKVDFNVALPRFQPQQFNLVGARLSHLADHKAALVRYQKGLHNYSLFVVTDPGGSLGSQKCQRVKAREFCLTELKGYTVLLWRSRGLAYSLVGETAPPEMLEVISTAFSF